MPVAALPIAVLAGVRLTLVVWPVILVLAAGSAQPLHLPRKRMGKHREAGIGVVLRSKVGSTERMAEGWQNHGNDGLRKNLFEYGDIKLVSKVASVRKSILAMLYGRDVANGKINLKKTVKELGLDDVELFLPIEQRATLEHLITARSGIYLRSGEYEDDLAGTMPKRGAHHPGTYFHYHNWDFNAAGTAFEKLTGLDSYDALEAELAKPIVMQDFDRKRQKKVSAMPYSVHPEYAMYLSTRDMARIGLLMLHDGRWGEKEVLPPGWAQQITSVVTPYRDMNPPFLSLLTRPSRWAYGAMWWVWDAAAWPGLASGPFQRAYTAWGANGQFITVLPVLDMVVAHKVNIDKTSNYQVTQFEFQTIRQMIISANCGSGNDCWQ